MKFSFLIILFLSLFGIQSDLHANVIGKGLHCNTYSSFPGISPNEFFYFTNDTTVEIFEINGYDIVSKMGPYKLEGTKTIRIESFGRVDRETLLATSNFSQRYICTPINSRYSLIVEINKIINQDRKSNKF